MFRRLFNFCIYSSLFIAGCAVLMLQQTVILFKLHLPPATYLFVFSGSMCSYNFHWYLESLTAAVKQKRTAWSVLHQKTQLAFFIAGLVGSLCASVALFAFWPPLLLTAVLTFLYSAPKIEHPWFLWLRKIAIAKTIYLALVWTLVTVFLPLFISGGNWQGSFTWFIINRFFFIYAICIVFDSKDRGIDKAAGIRSLITYLTHKNVDRLFGFSVIVSLLSLLIFLDSWPPLQLLILTIPTIILALLYDYLKQNFADYLYYFLLDGLMALSAAILILATFAR